MLFHEDFVVLRRRLHREAFDTRIADVGIVVVVLVGIVVVGYEVALGDNAVFAVAIGQPREIRMCLDALSDPFGAADLVTCVVLQDVSEVLDRDEFREHVVGDLAARWHLSLEHPEIHVDLDKALGAGAKYLCVLTAQVERLDGACLGDLVLLVDAVLVDGVIPDLVVGACIDDDALLLLANDFG